MSNLRDQAVLSTFGSNSKYRVWWFSHTLSSTFPVPFWDLCTTRHMKDNMKASEYFTLPWMFAGGALMPWYTSLCKKEWGTYFSPSLGTTKEMNCHLQKLIDAAWHNQLAVLPRWVQKCDHDVYDYILYACSSRKYNALRTSFQHLNQILDLLLIKNELCNYCKLNCKMKYMFMSEGILYPHRLLNCVV